MNDIRNAPEGARIIITEEEGVRSLHFGSPWTQGAVRLATPDHIEIEYVQQMMMWLLFKPAPRHVVQLGLGAASLTRFCHRHLPDARVTAVELHASVIDACRHHFFLPPDDDRLTVLHGDAMDYVRKAARGSVDIMQVDLYDSEAIGPVLDSLEFYQACADSLAPDGVMTVNLFCDYPGHLKSLDTIGQAFEALAWLPEVHDGNIVAIAFKRAPVVDFDALYARAAQIQEAMSLPASTWVRGLHAWMQEG
ncbi:MAG TPA: spermidine synthase [Burkholderiaceae bacterium]|nr:spermidine synthase [Burkholderiaceae bacterium]